MPIYILVMGKFLVTTATEKGIFIVRSSGYIDEKGGSEIVKAVQSGITKESKKFILNFKDSPVINSQGISQIIEIAEIVVDELNGDLDYVGLSESAYGVFKMVGLLQIGTPCQTEEEAIADLAD